MTLALLVLHVLVGAIFIGHGSHKIFGIWGGFGLTGTAEFFESIGLRPGWLQVRIAGTCELVFGTLLMLGLLTTVAAMVGIAILTAAIVTYHWRRGIWDKDEGYEYHVTLIAVLFALASIGAGRWSLDHVLSVDLNGTGWGLAALGLGVLGGVGAVITGRMVPARTTPAADS